MVFDTWGMFEMSSSTGRDTVCGMRVHTRVCECSTWTCHRSTLDIEEVRPSVAYMSCAPDVREVYIASPDGLSLYTPSPCISLRGKRFRGRRVRSVVTSCCRHRIASRYFIRIVSSTRFLNIMIGSTSCSERHVGHSSDVSNQVRIHWV